MTLAHIEPLNCVCVCLFQEVDVCKPLGVSLHTVSNGAAPPSAVLPAAAVLPAYSTLPLMPGFLGAPHPAAVTPSPVPHTHAATPDWNTYYYVSKENSSSSETPLGFLFSAKIQTFHFVACLLRLILWEFGYLKLNLKKSSSSVTGWIQMQPPFKLKLHKY